MGHKKKNTKQKKKTQKNTHTKNTAKMNTKDILFFLIFLLLKDPLHLLTIMFRAYCIQFLLRILAY